VHTVGWNHHLNRKARRGRLDVYQLAPVLHREADFVQLQVFLLSERRLRKYKRRVYAGIDAQLCQLWQRYEAGEITTSKLLRCCSHVNGPVL